MPSQPIPVLLLAQQFGQGGSERQLVETAKALNRAEFEPHAGCLRPSGFRIPELRASGVAVDCFPVESFFGADPWRAARKLGEYTRRHGVRLIHSFDTPANTLLGFALATRLCLPEVALASQRASRSLVPYWKKILLRATDRLVDGMVVNCLAMERHMRDEERMAADRIHVCYNGIDLDMFQAQRSVRLPVLKDAALVIGVVCALRPEKGLATLMDAYARTPRPAGTKLLIAGSGPEEQPLRSRAARLGIGSETIFEPSSANVAPWLHSIDIFVLPSFSEAFSNSIMEAMACGCCVVASNVGGNPELVIQGETGLLFPAGDTGQLAGCLQRLIEDPQLRNRLSAAGTVRMQRSFPLKASVQRMEEIYRKFL